MRRVQLVALAVRPVGSGDRVIRHPQCTHAGDTILDHVLRSDPGTDRFECDYCGEPIFRPEEER